MAANPPTHSQTERADHTRARILDAAIGEFSQNGLAGARTEQIAEAAGVNKALLYYYFSGKDALYDAALEAVALRVVASSMAAMETERSAGERLLHFTLNHFDRIHTQRAFQSLMQQEMIRLHRGEENALTPIVERVFRPMMFRLREVFAEGSSSGELIQVDELQIMYAALGANVFYFLSAPVMGLLLGTNPLERSALEYRRRAAVEYLGQTIFTDREHGAHVAARVLAATPMPQPGESQPTRLHTGEIKAGKIRLRESEAAATPSVETRQK
jgi:TetR/AcrR family transcriptional regulator